MVRRGKIVNHFRLDLGSIPSGVSSLFLFATSRGSYGRRIDGDLLLVDGVSPSAGAVARQDGIRRRGWRGATVCWSSRPGACYWSTACLLRLGAVRRRSRWGATTRLLLLAIIRRRGRRGATRCLLLLAINRRHSRRVLRPEMWPGAL